MLEATILIADDEPRMIHEFGGLKIDEEGHAVHSNGEIEENKNFYCDVIADEAQKMNKLVKQLLELSQLQSGNFELERTEKVEVVESGDKVQVAVYNSGSSIPDDKTNMIWKSFYKIDKSRTRSYGGSGLGLSIVKAIQNAHDNSFGVCNVEGGVLFWFELDRAKR